MKGIFKKLFAMRYFTTAFSSSLGETRTKGGSWFRYEFNWRKYFSELVKRIPNALK